MSGILSPRGRANLQRTLFAPDWGISTMQSWTDAAGLSGAERAAIARRYIVRGQLYNQFFGNLLQAGTSGTLMIDNEPKDGSTDWRKRYIAKNSVRLPNGQDIILSKHFMEFPEAVADPKKAAVNKLSVPLKMGAEQVENKKYPVWPDSGHMSDMYPPDITTPGMSDLEGIARRGATAAGNFVPIPLQQIDRPWSLLGGMLGASPRGTPDDEKKGRAERKMEERRLRQEKRDNR
jgi:hypothetical protein